MIRQEKVLIIKAPHASSVGVRAGLQGLVQPASGHRMVLAELAYSQMGAIAEALLFGPALVIECHAGAHADAGMKSIFVLLGVAGARHVVAAMVGETGEDMSAAAGRLVSAARHCGLENLQVVPIPRERAAQASSLNEAGLRVLHAALETSVQARMDAPFRMSLVKTHGPNSIAGRMLSGAVAKGDQIVITLTAETAQVTSIKLDDQRGTTQLALDSPLSAAPGTLIAAAKDRPEVSDQIAAHIVWVDGDAPMLPGRSYAMNCAGQRVIATVTALKHRLNTDSMEHAATRALHQREIGFCNLSFSRPIAFDASARNLATGSFAVHDSATEKLIGYGFIAFGLRRATNIHWQAIAIDHRARAAIKGQKSCCLWFTGLSGSGKSTIASLLDKRLHALGHHTYVLDGDNVRHGLNRDLGFTDADRVENIRRVAEVAKLMADAGLIVMVSFISPFRAERLMARELFMGGEFLELHVDTPLAVCEQRDPKGLYKKARAGLVKNFTGIDSAYEPPETPELRLEPAARPAEALVEQILADLNRRGLIGGPQ